MILINCSRNDPLGQIGPSQNASTLIEDFDDIAILTQAGVNFDDLTIVSAAGINWLAILDAPFFGIRGMDPDRFVKVVIWSLDLAGWYLPQPGDVVALSMDSPSRMVRDDQERVLLPPGGLKSFLVSLPFWNPVWDRRPLLIVREMLRQA